MRDREGKRVNLMLQGQSQIDTATVGNGDIRTDRTGRSPGKKKSREKKKKKKTGCTVN